MLFMRRTHSIAETVYSVKPDLRIKARNNYLA